MTLTQPEIRVLVIASDMLTRAGLAALLNDQSGIAVAGQTSGEDDISPELDAYLPDVLVWDLGWEPSSAIERLAELPDDAPPVVALLSEESHVSDAWTGGARGILRRDADAESLTAAIHSVARGLVTLEPEFMPVMRPSEERAPSPLAFELTPRESEVLRHLAEGVSNKSIAFALDISEHTVKFHVNSIMGKLNAQSRTEAVINATRSGLIPL